MAKRIPLDGFIGPAYALRSINSECEKCVNLYTELIETGRGKDKYSLNKVPGLQSQVTPEVGRVRGMTEVNGILYATVGTHAYSIDSGFTATRLGAVSNASNGPATVAASRTQIGFVADGNAYLYTIATGTFTQITWFGAGQKVVSVGYLNGYFLFLKAEGDGFFYSNPGDANAGTALQVVVADASANNYVWLVVDHEEVWLFGNRITQVFATTTDPNFPFIARLSDGTIQQGVDAPASVAAADNSLFMLGGDARGRGIVWRMNGYTPVRVSNHGVEYAIRKMATTSDAVGWTYQEDGHIFYVLNFITESQTWALDLSTGHWHERPAWDGGFIANRGYCATAAFGKIIVGDRTNGKIYVQSLDYFDADGDIIKWVRRSPDMNNLGARIAYSRFELLAETGNVGNLGPTADPQVIIEWSNDNGNTFGNQYFRSMGMAGEFDKMIYVNRCGIGRNRVWQVSGTDAIPIHLQGATVDVEARKN